MQVVKQIASVLYSATVIDMSDMVFFGTQALVGMLVRGLELSGCSLVTVFLFEVLRTLPQLKG